MFWKKREPEVRDPLPIPDVRMWRVEQTDGFRNIEAHEYEKCNRSVTFYLITGSRWRFYEYIGWEHQWIRVKVCELNWDYVMSIEESI